MRAAFGVGWVLWFAYIVAGVLYALGFAEYALLMVAELWRLGAGHAPALLGTHRAAVLLAIVRDRRLHALAHLEDQRRRAVGHRRQGRRVRCS